MLHYQHLLLRTGQFLLSSWLRLQREQFPYFDSLLELFALAACIIFRMFVTLWFASHLVNFIMGSGAHVCVLLLYLL
jgi:hypothetical protein